MTLPTEKKDIAMFFFMMALLGATGSFLYVTYDPEGSLNLYKKEAAAAASYSTPQIALDPNAIDAQAAVIYDPVTKQVLFEKNAQAQLPLASLTKLAAARAVLSSLSPDTQVTVSDAALSQDGDSHLHAGDTWSLGKLVAYALTTSSNDAIAAAADALPGNEAVQRMNKAAQDENLAQTYFLNPTGLDVSSSTAGAYGSALDIAHIAEDLLHEYPSIFEATTKAPITQGDSGKDVPSTLEPLWSMPGLIAAKTGFTDLAGGNLVAVVDMGLGEPVIAVVLGSSRDGRFTDMRTLIKAARASYAHAN